MKSKLLAVGLLSFALPAKVEAINEVDNLICGSVGSRDKSRCELPKNAFEIESEYEVEATFKYNFANCTRYASTNSNRLEFRIKSESGNYSEELVYGESGTVSAEGTSFYIEELRGRLLYARHEIECSLAIEYVGSKASQATIDDWKNNRAAKQELLSSKEELLDAYEYLAILKPGFDLIEQVAEIILKDLTASDHVVETIKRFQSCKQTQGGDTIDCKLFENLLADGGGRLTFPEKLLINKISSDILLIDATKPKTIENYLDESQKKTLAGIATKASEFADLDSKISLVTTEITNLEAEITRLDQLIGD